MVKHEKKLYKTRIKNNKMIKPELLGAKHNGKKQYYLSLKGKKFSDTT